MHELALTEGIIAIVEQEGKKNGFTRVLEISLKVGELSGVIPECLLEFFPIASKGTLAEGAKLVLERVPAAFSCPDCGFEGPLPRHSAVCPDCGSERIRLIIGREFFVENLKVE